MADAPRTSYQPSAGITRGVGGAVLMLLSWLFFLNLNEEPTVFGAIAVVLFAMGAYNIIAGAIARGIQLARATDRP